jgi:hypothetical protein
VPGLTDLQKMNLTQKRIFRGKQSITLNDGQIDIRHSSLSSKSEWTVNLSELSPSPRHLKRVALGAWTFTGIFIVAFLFSLYGIFQADEGGDAFAVAWVFIFITLIPIALGLYKAVSESYDWTILDFKNGNPAIYLYSNSPSESEMKSFMDHLKQQIVQHSKNEKNDSIRKAVGLLQEQNILNPTQSEEIFKRLDQSEPNES